MIAEIKLISYCVLSSSYCGHYYLIILMTITACINNKIHNFGFDMQVGQFEGSSGQIEDINEFFWFICYLKPSQNEKKFTKYILHCPGLY